jgi:DNA (cytosine-5)-methyltransferase 1
MDNDNFNAWLERDNQFEVRSRKDVLCRLNRGISFLNVHFVDYPLDEVLMLLDRNSRFNELSTSVKSQIRRAFRLYYRYRAHHSL